MFLEVRNMMLLQRVLKSADCITARECLKCATLGGAQVLGRDDIGMLEPGYEADMIGVRLDSLRCVICGVGRFIQFVCEYCGQMPHVRD